VNHGIKPLGPEQPTQRCFQLSESDESLLTARTVGRNRTLRPQQHTRDPPRELRGDARPGETRARVGHTRTPSMGSACRLPSPAPQLSRGPGERGFDGRHDLSVLPAGLRGLAAPVRPSPPA